MIRKLKKITVNMVAGANVATAVLMWLVGFSDYVNPVAHPYIATVGLLFPFFLIINLCFLFFWLTFKLKMAIIPILGYAAAFVPLRIYIPINAPSTPPDGAMKLVSWNVHIFTGSDGIGSFEQIHDYLGGAGADIVCLQEAFGGPSNKFERLDSLFPHSSVDTISKTGGNALAIYSKFPIVRKERIPYKSDTNGSYAYYLLVDGDTVLVINNHFESSHLSPDERKRYKEMLKGEMDNDTARAESKRLLHRLGKSASVRAPQADSVHGYIAAHGDYPTIVCGDFNDNPISYTRRVVSKGLTDCYVTTGRGIGLSYNQKGFFVRIDNVFCSDHFQPYNCKVDKSVKASDHYPIVCWFEKQAKHQKKNKKQP